MDNQHNESKLPQLELDNLKAIKVLGKGAMGTVFLVHDNSTNPCNTSPFALKVVEKSLLPPGKSDPNRRARWEISVLSRLQKNPFLPSLLGSIETQEFIGWAMPFCPGNDLNALRFQQADHVFSPSIIRFYLAEIICALENLHNMGIVYRDLKPENILIQESGHVTLTDFDLSCNLAHAPPSKLSNTTNLAHAPPSKFLMTTNLAHTPPSKFSKTTKLAHAPPKLAHSPTSKSSNTAELAKNQNKKKPKSARVSPMNKRNVLTLDGRERSYSFVGTEEYVAPEIIRGEGHEFAVDWWALGVLAYEMLYGTSPFKGKNRKETYQRTVAAQPVFPGKLNVLTDLIQKLLEKDPTRRLGYYGGACEIKEHEFFKGLKWDLLTEVVRPPFIPSRQENDVMECGIDFKQYFQELKVATSFDVENCNVSLTEF